MNSGELRPDYVAITRRSYEESADRYCQKTATYDGLLNLESQVKDFAQAVPPGVVLDLGTGSGRDRFHLSRDHQVVSADICFAFLERLSGSTRVQLDARSLPFRDASFQGIWASAVYLHLTRDDTFIAIKEAERVLHSSGLLQINLKAGTGAGFEDSDGIGRRWFTYYQEDEIAAIVRNAKLDVVTLSSEIRKGTKWITARLRK